MNDHDTPDLALLDILHRAEEDVKALPRALECLEAFAQGAGLQEGLSAHQCLGLYELLKPLNEAAVRVEGAWGEAWTAAGGNPD